MRIAQDFFVVKGSHDPRGKPVFGADGKSGGTVVDLWVDRSECILRYLEIDTGAAGGHRRVLVPATFSDVKRRAVKVEAILGSQFSLVPGIRVPDRITLLEEEKICAFYGAGTLYATPSRSEPLI